MLVGPPGAGKTTVGALRRDGARRRRSGTPTPTSWRSPASRSRTSSSTTARTHFRELESRPRGGGAGRPSTACWRSAAARCWPSQPGAAVPGTPWSTCPSSCPTRSSASVWAPAGRCCRSTRAPPCGSCSTSGGRSTRRSPRSPWTPTGVTPDEVDRGSCWRRWMRGMTDVTRRSGSAARQPYDVLVGLDLAGHLPELVAGATQVAVLYAEPLRAARRRDRRRAGRGRDWSALADRDSRRRGRQVHRRRRPVLGRAGGGRVHPYRRGGRRRRRSGDRPGRFRGRVLAARRTRGARADLACSAWSTPRSAARPASTPPPARTWSARSIRRPACSATCPRWPRCRRADLRAGLAEVVKCGFIADPAILSLRSR